MKLNTFDNFLIFFLFDIMHAAVHSAKIDKMCLEDIQIE